MGDIELRIDKLEDEVKRWRIASGLILLLLVTAVLIGAKQNRIIEAESFVLKGLDGKTRATLTCTDNRPRLRFYSEKGQPVASMGINGDGAADVLIGQDSEARLWAKNGNSMLSLKGENSTRIVQLENSTDKQLTYIKGPTGITSLGILQAESNPLLTFTDSSDNVIQTFPEFMSSSTTDDSVEETSVTKTTSVDLEILDSRLEKGTFMTYVKGTLRNNTNKRYKSILVTINLYDNNGARIGEAYASVDDLGPKELWKFEAALLVDNVSSYKIREINGE